MDVGSQLKQEISKGNMVPFVGAGFSLNVTRYQTGKALFPSWRELLERAAKATGNPDDACYIRRPLRHSNNMEAAANTRKCLDPRWFPFLKDQFDPFKQDVDPKSLIYAHTLWRFLSKIIITINYDRVLEWACPDRERESWSFEEAFEQHYTLQNGLKRLTVWHLHGKRANLLQRSIFTKKHKLLSSKS